MFVLHSRCPISSLPVIAISGPSCLLGAYCLDSKSADGQRRGCFCLNIIARDRGGGGDRDSASSVVPRPLVDYKYKPVGGPPFYWCDTWRHSSCTVREWNQFKARKKRTLGRRGTYVYKLWRGTERFFPPAALSPPS